MRNSYLKIPKKLHNFCKKKNCLNEVVVYYQLKIINSSGYFRETTIISKMLTSGISNTESSCYYKLRKCIRLGVVKKTQKGYQVVSYDDLFSLLGYDLQYNYKRKRKGFFKIFKTRELIVENVKSWIQYVDIRDSLKQQRLNLYQSLRGHKTHPVSLSHHTQSSCIEILDQFTSNDIVQLYDEYRDDLNGYIYSLLSGKSEYKRELNLDVTLSLKGVCRVLGLTNVSSARDILTSLELSGFLQVTKRLVRTEIISSNIYYRVIEGQRYANLSNKLVCLV